MGGQDDILVVGGWSGCQVGSGWVGGFVRQDADWWVSLVVDWLVGGAAG